MEGSLRIAIVDDDEKFLSLLQEYSRKAATEDHISHFIEAYSDSKTFIEQYHCGYDILFLDIEMPEVNGFNLAKRIRELDETVCIIFVTNMAQYAIIGYEVNALDFMIKPFDYFSFQDKFHKAVKYCETKREKEITLQRDDEYVRVKYSQIYYLEKDKNYIEFHTSLGKFRRRGTMSTEENQFTGFCFGKISSGCLVNLRHVQKTSRNTVWIGHDALPISRQQQTPFMNQLMRYLGGER